MSRKVLLAVFLIITINIFADDIDILENVSNPDKISDTLNVEQADLINKPVKSNPFLYNRCIGSAMDGITYCIPIAIYLSRDYWEPHNNLLVYMVVYPMGFVFIEKFIKNLFIHKSYFTLQGPHSFVSMNGQLGIIAPTLYESSDGFSLPNINGNGFSKVSLQYEYQFNKSFGIQVSGERLGSMADFSDDYIFGFFGYSLGLRFTDWSINVNKIIFGYSYKYNDLKDYGTDFWGFGIGWSKRYYPYKKLFIEPGISYRYSRTADYSTSIIGLFGGVNVGYRF